MNRSQERESGSKVEVSRLAVPLVLENPEQATQVQANAIGSRLLVYGEDKIVNQQIINERDFYPNKQPHTCWDSPRGPLFA